MVMTWVTVGLSTCFFVLVFVWFFYMQCYTCLMFFGQPCEVINSIQVTGSSASNVSTIQTCTIFISSIDVPVVPFLE